MSKKLNGRGGRFVLLAAALLFAWGLRADTATVDGYTYTYSVTDGKATIGTGETVKTAVSPKPTGRLTVPSELGGYPVTGLGESAFYNCTGLTDVTIPNGVTHIGPRAFSCCSGLENVTIGSGVTSIEPYVFPSCVNLRNIAVDPANTAYMSQDGMLLTKDGTTLVYGVGGDVEIPSGVATIGTSAFFGRKLKSIRFSGSVTNIGSWAFGFCHDLDMSIPNAILKIGDYAFVECRNLNLWLPRRFEGNLNSSVFKQCSNLTVNYYDQVPVVAFRAEEGVVEQRECLPGTKVGSLPPAPTHERYAFEGWWTAADGEQATAETVVTNDVTYYAKWRGTAAVGDYTYTYSVLNGQAEIGASNAWKRAISPSPTGHVTVPSSLGGFPVVGIGDYAFYGLYSAHYKLESVTIPNGVTRIGKRAFSGCPNLTEVTIPASMAVVDDGAFSGCSNLKGVHISNLVNWCQITFVYSSNPLRQAHELYLNGERVTRLVIPEGVTSIGDDAFAGCSGLTEVTFPNSVTNIGNSSFMDCSGLMELVLPGSVAKIGIWAFRGCSGLTEVEIPHGVKVIGGGVFLDCSNLTKITVDPGNENYVSQKGLLLTKDGKTLMEGVNGTVVIPSSVTSIAYDAFAGRGGLTQVTLPNGIRTIDALAFSDCDSLTEVVIPSSVVNIGRLAFVRSGLTSISVEEGNEFYSSRNGMLLSKDGTTLIQGVNGEVEFPPCVRMIGEMAFMRCSGLTRLVIPDSVTNIASKAFAYYRGLTDAWLPRHLEGKFSANVFEDCGNMTLHYYDRAYTVTFQTEEGIVEQRQCLTGMSFDTLPPSPTRDGYTFEGWWTAADGEQVTGETVVTNDVTYYAKWRGTAAVDDYKYTYSVLNGQAEIGSSNAWTTAVSPKPTGHVVVPSSLGGFPVVGIGKRAFSSCFILEGVTIPEGVTAIGEDAFAYCYKLEDVTIPEGVVAIGEYAFVHCSKLEGVTIPESVTTIGQYAFQWCRGLKSVHISDLAKWCQIKFGNSDANPLYQAHELYLNGEHVTELVIPEGVTSIGAYAFVGCSGLTDVTIPDGVTTIGAGAFLGCNGLMELLLPGSIVRIGSSAFSGCSGLTEVEIPHGVKAIGGSVFSDCSNLTKITVEPGNENYVSQNGLLLTKDGKTLLQGVNGVVVIPSSVTRINNFAFSGRDSLTQVTIPNGIREIGWFAFSGCDSLTKVVIPSSVVNIEPRAFVSSGLTSIAVEEGNEFYSSRNGMLLSKDGTLLIQGVNGEVEFPPCVRMIGEMAFMECSGLTRLVIPDSVTNIASKAFAYYRGLTDAWLPRHLEGKFSANVFEDCGNMTLHYYDRAYTVTFQTEEGIVEQRQCPAGMSFDTLPPSPSRDGYAFEGWWTAVDGEQASEATVVTNSVTYYAKWRGTAAVDDYTYTYSVLNGQAEIGSSNHWTTAVSPKPTGHVTVPSSLGGFPVVGIGKYAFVYCYNLEGVTIPSGVTSIGERAFYDCSNLTSLTIPEGVTAIGECTFSHCSKLEGVTIPESVTAIGQYAFDGCSKLKSVHISDLTAWCQIKFGYHANPLREAHELYLNGERVTKLILPVGLKAVGTEAFAGCSGLTEVTIPDGITIIGNRAFSGCSGLTEVTLPNGVTSIGNSAFSGCSGLTEVTLPNGVTTIGDSAFSGCRGLTEVEIPHGVKIIDVGVFAGCSGLTKITVDPKNANYMSQNGLLLTKDGKTLKEGVNGEVVIPLGVTKINARAFADRDGLTKVTIPAGVEFINWEAFYGCDGLVDVAIPGSVTNISEYAFFRCVGLKSVTIPENVVSIGRRAFNDCWNLTEVTIPNSVTNIGDGAFHYCSRLESVTVPACMLETGLGSVFPGISSITNVVVSEGVQSIPRGAFGSSGSFPKLEHVFIPGSVTNINVEAFSAFGGKVAVTVDPANAVYSSWNGMLLTKDGTRLLQGVNGDVTIPPGVTSIDARAFYECNLTSLTIPSSVTSIGERAFYNCSNLTDLMIPDSVTDIGDSAFGNCRSLRNVWLPKHLEGKLSASVFANCGNAALNYYDALYCVTFRTEEGIVEQRQCPAGMKVGTLPSTPTHEGYAFEGWWTAADGEKAIEKTVVTNDVAYYAKWRGTATVDGYTYTYSVLNGQAEIGSSNTWTTAVSPKPTGDVVIPSTLNGYPVTGIGLYAFYGFGPTSFEIPEGVVDIRKFAFRYSSLTNVVIPSSVTNIHVWAFEFCDRQVNFTVDPANAVYSSRNGLLLSKDGRTLVRGVNGEVVIPSCVTEIGGSAFEGCRGLRSVVIPDGVLDIGTNAFQYCQVLMNMTIPQSVTNIGTRAFTGCSSMENFSVDMANGFYTSLEGMLLTKDAEILIRGNTGNDGEVVIPDGVKVIDEFAFDDLLGLEYVTIPSSVTTISDSAFEECWDLTQISIPNSVKTIGTRVFCRCMSLTNVSLPNSLTTIGRDTFADCRSLTSIEIPREVTEIGMYAFGGCTGLTSRVVIPDNVTSIERGAFTLCKGLKEVWLPRSLEERFYLYDVFSGCDEALVLNYYDTPLHTIVFRSDEGADKWRLCPAGVTLGDLPPSPTRAGAVFSGWWTADGEPVSTETVVTGDMTLEARWHVVAAPEIIPMNCNGATFWDRCYVEIMCKDRDAVIYYSTDGQIPHLTEAYRYKGEFRIDRTTTIRAIAVLDGVRSACVTATFERECSMPQYRDGSYDYDAVELTFTTGGDAGWHYTWTQSGSKYSDYEKCLQSGQIGNEEESWLQTSVVGRGTFSFRWKVDCEYDDFGEAAWDHLAVFTNGVEAVRMDGTRGWERMSFTFDDDGRHTIRWVFVKDGYDEENAAYEDCAWLGRFSWNPADVTVDAGKGRTVTVPGAWLGKRTMRAATDVAANWRRVWECYLLGLDPEEADDDFRIASFEVVDGVPAFTFSHTRDGSGVSFESRIRILGKARLDDAAWTEMPEGGDPALRFFKAEVALP